MKLFKQLNKSYVFLVLIPLYACNFTTVYPEFNTWVPYDETALLDSSQQNDNVRLRYKRIQSKTLDRNDLLQTIRLQLDDFTEDKYNKLSAYIYENSIQDIQSYIKLGVLTYKELTQWYLYSETDKNLSLNAIISVNPKAVETAETLDHNTSATDHPIYGMPILLKDNINTADMPTMAGAIALQQHQPTEDAQIVTNLKRHGAVILGKVNLSEWANFLCAGCPNGYSAIGGQTLNPYGMRRFDTGGSSSGSAVSVAVNFAVGAIGSETSGSILSPASQQSLVGLKPTVTSSNQKGIIPISSTLDTPGPITRTVEDNAIIFSAMMTPSMEYQDILGEDNASALKLGAFQNYMKDSLYQHSIEMFRQNGVQIEIVEPPQMDFSGFLTLLNGDMKRDLKTYLNTYASDSVSVRSVQDVINFNSQDSLLNMPYNQSRLDGIVAQELDDIELDSIRQKLIHSGKFYFDVMMDHNNLDAVLSVNNYNAGQAAVAKYPAITVPMGYTEEGEPKGITIIAKSGQEELLLKIADFYEEVSKLRIPPEKFNIKLNIKNSQTK